MTTKRLPGEEALLLRAVLDRLPAMLQYYGLNLVYSIDIPDNAYTVNVTPDGLDNVGAYMRLQRYDELRAILEEVVCAPDERSRELAMQRAGCMLDSRLPRAVE